MRDGFQPSSPGELVPITLILPQEIFMRLIAIIVASATLLATTGIYIINRNKKK